MRNACLLLLMSGAVLACGNVAEAAGWQQKEFIVTMWCPPPATDENLAILVRDGYSLTTVSPAGDAAAPAGEAVKALEVARRNGIQALLSHPLLSPGTLDDPARKAKLDALIDAVKTHPALAGYHLTDEPQATAFPAWAKLTRYLRGKDPDHLAYINLYPTYANQQQLAVFLKEPPKGPVGIPDNFAGAGTNQQTIVFYNEYLRLFVDQVKPGLISYDHYHFLRDGRDGEQYFLNLALIRMAAAKAKVPFLNIVQACTIESSWRLPTEDELRWLAYTTMAYGGRGISWFLYWGPAAHGGCYQDGKRMPIADQVARVNQEIKALGPELMKLTSTQVYHTAPLPTGTQAIADACPVTVTGGPFVLGLFAQQGVENAFMVMNRDDQANATATLTLRLGKGKLMAFSVSQRRWVEVQAVENGSRVEVDLPPGGGRLFKVVAPARQTNGVRTGSGGLAEPRQTPRELAMAGHGQHARS